MTHPSASIVPRRVPFDEVYFDRSKEWLADTELVWLIRADPVADQRERQDWFEGLDQRADYAVWGIEYSGQPVGVMGIKQIGLDDGAEYFMYIGERQFWRKGIGRWALREIQSEVRSRGLTWVYGRIAHHNERSMRAHLALGMRPLMDEEEVAVVAIRVDEPVNG
jgi:RimJ/RimL family protein N-acetyltransferase